MINIYSLVQYLNQYLAVEQFQDYAPNGLQVEGKHEVRRVVSGVSASAALIDAAIARDADALLVHHGYFWKGESLPIVGMKRRRIGALLGSDISLLAYHLPLDGHPECGNNVQLARVLGFDVRGPFGSGRVPIGMHGRLAAPLTGEDFARHLTERLRRPPLHVSGRAATIETVAWCTGAAQGYIEEAVALGVDAYVSGEVSEQTVHVARECGIHYFACGHHATERYGVQALGEHLADRFHIDHVFVDIDNPV
jgi:dinuclear metal center YbgI/SA1388 family protein